jgi:predicted amino acid dehydrogenase
LPPGTATGNAAGTQFFFTYVDFEALGQLTSETLAVRWDASRAEMEPPPAGTDLLLAARPIHGGLQLTLQGAASAFTDDGLRRFADGLSASLKDLANSAGPGAVDRISTVSLATPSVRFSDVELSAAGAAPLDAALIGYLPTSMELAALAGLEGDPAALRDLLRKTIFPQGRPRWLEALETPVGRSGYICLPWFAEELTPADSLRLVPSVIEGIHLAANWGARCVSLAGTIPSLTGYGLGVLNHPAMVGGPALTTGHATTVVSVVKTIKAALTAVDCDLAELNLACVGLGSIGQASLELLLAYAPHPRSIVLCDVQGSTARLTEFAQRLRNDTGYAGAVMIAEASTVLPDAVYEADVIVGATSTAQILDVEQLRPSTIVVDDSFPHCFDPARAIARMRNKRDLLVVGGGLLHCGSTERTVYVPTSAAHLRDRIASSLPQGGVASCQLESLLHAANPALPLTHGLVNLASAKQYWIAVQEAGCSAGTLHLGTYIPGDELLERLRVLRI